MLASIILWLLADTLDGLALVFLACGKIADAKFTHERAFFIRKTVLGSDHPALGDSQFRLAQVSRRLGRTDQAGALFERYQIILCLILCKSCVGYQMLEYDT